MVNNNILFLIKKAFRWDKKLFLISFINSILHAIKPIILLLYPKLIIEGLYAEVEVYLILWKMGMITLALILCIFMGEYLNGVIYGRVMNLRNQFLLIYSEKCISMEYQYTEDKEKLNQMHIAFQAINNNSEGIEGVYHTIFSFLTNIMALFGYSLILISLSPIVMLVLIISILVNNNILWKIKKFEYSLKDDVAFNQRMLNYFENIMTDFSYGKEIRIFNLVYLFTNKFNKAKVESLEVQSSIEKKHYKAKCFSTLIEFITSSIILSYLVWNTLNGNIHIANFVLYYQTINNYGVWINNILEDVVKIRKQNLVISDFKEFVYGNEMESQSYKPIDKADSYELELVDLHFHYPNSKETIIKGIDLKLKKGVKLAIVGPNGAGKTTLVKLITGLYKPTSGEILLNGSNIEKYKSSEYFKLFSTVFQENIILAMSIKENIAFRDENPEKLRTCINISGLEEKIQSLPKHEYTQLLKFLDKEGIELSGGENQKLMLARALYKEGDIYVFDEPTSNLDSMAEASLYEKFNEIVKDHTTIFISHRLASTRFCDSIIYINNGVIVEMGSHEELMKKNGSYAKMFAIQSQYYKKSTSNEEVKYYEF